MNAASIKKVIFNPPATIVFWSDGTKTVVKCHVKDIFDPEKGLAMAVAKRCADNNPDFYQEIRKWIDESGYKPSISDKTVEAVYHTCRGTELMTEILLDQINKLFHI